ncbi:MAG: prenyltransferase/squalene oxidase repeat-containing protein, partial [Candidatus Helarchaeota archaeon]
DKEKVENFIFRHQAPVGGFFNIIKQPDMWTTFYAIFSLALLNRKLSDDEKSLHVRFIKSTMNNDGLFSHCKNPDCICGGQVTLKSTFFALFTLHLLDSLDVIEPYLRNTKYLAKKISKQKIDNLYLLLCRKLLNLEINDEWTIILSKFQKNDGGFGQKEFGTIFETFWMASFLKANDWLTKINMGKLYNFLNSIHKKDGGFNDKLIGVPSDLITTAQGISTMIMLTPELINFLENEILKQVAFQKEVYLKSITEEFYVNERLILNVVKNMMNNYNWFEVDLIKFRNVFNAYLKNLDDDEQRIANKIMKQIRKEKIDLIDLNSFAKSFRKIKNKEEKVKKVVSNLIKHRFIVGSIEFSRKLLKKTLFLKIYFVPDDLIMKKKDYPYEVIIAEKEEFKIENERVKQITLNAQRIPTEFTISIMTLLDSGEVELAREKLEKNFANQIKILETLDKEVEKITEKFQYIDFSRQMSVKIWKNVEKEVLKKLNNTRSYLDREIKEKERIIKAYEELEALVNFINNNLSSFDKMIEDTINKFNETCLKERIDQEQKEIQNEILEIEKHIQEVAEQVKSKANEIANYSKNVNALKNIIITEEKGLSKKIITQVRETLEPFDYWLENQWNRKRESSRERLSDINSKIFRRNELLREIEARKKDIYQRIDMLSQEIDEDELDNKITKILEAISSTGQYIENYILDTNILLDGFANIVAIDIPRKWSEDMGFIYLKLNDKRREVKKKILNNKEIEQKEILESIIEKHMITLKEMIKKFDYLDSVDFTTSDKSLEDLLQENVAEIASFKKKKTDEIKKFIKKSLKEFSNFHITTNILVNKWQTFLQGLETVMFQKREKIIESVLVSLLNTLSTPENGGRVEIAQLNKYLGLKKRKVKEKIEKLMLYSKIEAVFDEKEENIIPLKSENKKQLEYEEKISKFINDTEKEHVMKFFRKVCEKKLLKDNASEIYVKVDKLYKKLEEIDAYLGKEFKFELSNPYNSKLNEMWEERKNEIYVDLNQIITLLDVRQEFGVLVNNSLEKIEKEVEDINNFIIKQIQDKIGITEDLNLKLEVHVKNYKMLLEEEKKKQLEFIRKQESNFHNFHRIVIDLSNHFNKEVSKIERRFLKNKEKLEERIRKFQTELQKERLKEKIIENKELFQNSIEKFDDVRNLIENGRLNEANTLLRTHHLAMSKNLKRLNNEIKSFIDDSEKKYNLINFKDSCRGILRDWDLEEMKDTLNNIKLTIENQLILKHIEFAEKAYSTSKIKLNLIASKLDMKTNKLKERLYHILGVANINVKISPYKNEIVFTDKQMSKIREIELEKTIEAKLSKEVKELDTLGSIIKKIARFWGPILTFAGALIGIAFSTYQVLGLSAILIPIIGISALIFFSLIYYKKYGKVVDIED